jgi:hypothetical protein
MGGLRPALSCGGGLALYGLLPALYNLEYNDPNTDRYLKGVQTWL